MPQISCKQKVVVHSLVTKNLEIHSFIHAFIDSFPHSLIHSFGSAFTCGAGVVVPLLKKGLNTQCNARLEFTSKYDAQEKISDLKTMQKRIFDHRKETGFCPKDRLNSFFGVVVSTYRTSKTLVQRSRGSRSKTLQVARKALPGKNTNDENNKTIEY